MILNDIRVLDLTRVLAGPWCTQMLADYGAEVIKIESPGGGDDSRKIPPFFDTENRKSDKAPMSAFFACTNRGKSSEIVDIKTTEGQQRLYEIAEGSDIFIENFKVGNLKKYGLDYESIRKINPTIIYCSITGYGQSGPMSSYPGYDLLFQGVSGAMSTCGLPDTQPGGGPMRTIIPHTDVMTGMYACNSILAALMHLRLTGEGQYIDVALLDVAIATNTYIGAGYLATGKGMERIGNSGVAASPSGVYPCKDGWVIVQCNDSHWSMFCKKLDRMDLFNDARFISLHARLENAVVLDELIIEITQNYHKREFALIIATAGIPCVPVNTIDEAFMEPQVVHRGLVVEAKIRDGRNVPVVRHPVLFSNLKLRPETLPNYGEHTEV